jgi:hypothetical protein
MQSSAFRTVGTTQVSLSSANSTYLNQSMPSGYRDVPVVNTDDEGYCNADAGALGASCSPTTPIISVTYAQHIAMNNCGMTQPTIAARIADCKTQNPSVATWDGAVNGTSGEATWMLVTKLTADSSNATGGLLSNCVLAVGAGGLQCVFKETWQDQRTGLIWSSLVAGALNNNALATGSGMLTANWCKASGNSEASDITCGSANNVSFCSEVLTPAITGENWVAGAQGNYTYDKAKGGMGRYSSPSVMWRLPTIHDYNQAEADGIRFVMPDMGGLENGLYDWTASIDSGTRSHAWQFNGTLGYITSTVRTNPGRIRCVAR